MAMINDYQQTNVILKGLTPEEVEASREQYGTNLITPPPANIWWEMLLEKFADPIVRILLIAAFLAIGVGLIDGTYVEGIGIIVAILLATLVAFINEYNANKEFDILNQTNNSEPIEVLRNGNFTTIPKQDLVVGDLAVLETGQEIPGDGEVIEAVSLQVDESKLTGEDRPVTKHTIDSSVESTTIDSAYPADKLLRGTFVVNGHGMIKVTAVGDRTEIGSTAKAIQSIEQVETPLNIQLDRLSRLIGVLALLIAVLIDIALVTRGIITRELDLSLGQWYCVAIVFTSLLIALICVWLPILYDGIELTGKDIEPPQWLAKSNLTTWLATLGIGVGIFALGIGLGYSLDWIPATPRDWIPREAASTFLTYFMIAVAIIVVAVPEGLALSVTLSLAYSMQKMAKQNNLVRTMNACETIGAATVICSDKTGTLTQNKMGISELNFPEIDPSNLVSTETGKLLIEAFAVNSTANLQRNPDTVATVIGNPTEGALLLWLEANGVNYLQYRGEFAVTDQLTFSSEKKYMATLGTAGGKRVIHVKGAPDVLLSRCTKIRTESGVESITEEIKANLTENLQKYEARGKRTLAFAYVSEPENYQDGLDLEKHADSLIWLGFVAISDPIRPEVPQAIDICHKAGIDVKMITGDSYLTAIEIAHETGILAPDDDHSYIMGSDLRAMDDPTALLALKQAKVIARARPQDKQRIVKLLQSDGEVVAVTGDGTNDAPALKQAQVGLAMGKIGTSVAKEASDIIILDDSFGSIELGVMWGRSLYQNIQKFILFQLTINVAACGIALLGPFIGIDLPFTVTQLLWINLIMDTFAALALATEPPSEKVMEIPPRNPEEFIISKPMALNIFTVAPIFLIIFVSFLIYIQRDQIVDTYELSLFFSTFVMLQFWNLFNAKTFGLKESAFANISESKAFLAIALIIFVGQILMVQYGGSVFRTVPLSWRDWFAIVGSTSLILWIGEARRLFARLKSA
ncbi:calcium-translocating P-type ATPase, PMCA-type [Gloeocapsa sp. PCC 73106]|uniref:calcium-translocating P-type ATPase, PMCA-type n=1 Tax=Gloeocapsa sp. PCC 73106 TaxID=102232 RepID=UPI0002ACFE14|nr:calcium-translocating P-type ATPase, PMCA-type [Gloeocapsa sp. PCC 73106]ELR97109.1 plasma-membrane calcium-translocating P-type ATPase [Gloeocapsa sp. PCC 73106]